jgi:hypothetical protein
VNYDLMAGRTTLTLYDGMTGMLENAPGGSPQGLAGRGPGPD